MIADLNPVLRGWGNYFRTGNAAGKFPQADRHVCMAALKRLLVKKHGRNLHAGQADQWTEDSTDADTPHCNITDAQGIRVARNGSFTTRFHVRTGIIGDGYCGTVGHPSCVIGIGTAQGLGTVVKITFAPPAHSGAAG